MKKIRDIIICVLFAAFIAGMFPTMLLLPENTFSDNEKRYLAPLPDLSISTIADGTFAEKIEDYISDHLPGREMFVGLNAYIKRFIGMKSADGIYQGKSGRLYETPVLWNPAFARRNMNYINDFAEETGTKIDFVLIPSAGYIMQDDMTKGVDPYNDGDIISEIYAMCGEKAEPLDIVSVFERESDRDGLFYATDHHWTSEGAFKAFQTFAESKDISVDKEKYEVSAEGGFRGTTYTRSALWKTPAENIELWKTEDKVAVYSSEEDGVHRGVFYEEYLQAADKYPVFLGGNHAYVRLVNETAGNDRKILVIRDSFSNCLGCFLPQIYGETVMIDLRYYKSPVSELLKETAFDDVLIMYGLKNFMYESNLGFLE